jgi:hypothetical protein
MAEPGIMWHMACVNCEKLVDTSEGWHIREGTNPGANYGGKSFCDMLCVFQWLKERGFDKLKRK